MTQYFYCNGQFYESNSATINSTDRGFLLGDGMFTTIKIVRGKALFLTQHLKRLQQHLQIIRINYRLSHHEISETLKQLIAKNDLAHANGSLRITITRQSDQRGLAIPEQATHNLLMQVFPLNNQNHSAYHLKISHIRRNHTSPLSQTKSLNYLDMVLIKQTAKEQQLDDGLLLNLDHQITCTSCANIYCLLDNNQWLTPPVTDGVLAGIVRQQLLSTYPSLSEASLTPKDLRRAQAIVISNSLIGIQAVKQIDDMNGDCLFKCSQAVSAINQLQQHYKQLITRELHVD